MVNKVTQSRDLVGASVPYGVLGLLAMVEFWIVATLVETAAGERNYPIIKFGASLLVFVIAVTLL